MEEDALFEVSLKSFVDERKALATTLRAAKRADAVKRVLAMPKPSAGAWSLNQVARKDAPLLAAYLEAHDALAAAHMQSAGRERIFATAHGERAAKKALVDRAVAFLAADGQKPSKAVLDALPTTLHASAMDPTQRAVLLAGRLLADVEAADFSTLALLAASQGLGPTVATPPIEVPEPRVEALPEAAPLDPAPEVAAVVPLRRGAAAGDEKEREARATNEKEAKEREAKEREAKEREAKEREAKLAADVEALRKKREEIAGVLRSARAELVTAQRTLLAAQASVAAAIASVSKGETLVSTSEAALLEIEAECDEAADALASAR